MLESQDLGSWRILPSAERYFVFMLYFVFALYERENEIQIKLESTMLPQAKWHLRAATA